MAGHSTPINQIQKGIISVSEISFVEDATGFTDAVATIRSPTETDFTSVLNGSNISKSIDTHSSSTPHDVNSLWLQSVSSGSSRGKTRVRSVGRGGAGNILNTETLELDLIYEATILRRRRLLADQINPRAKVSNTGRGGKGNILAASSSTPYDPSKDPDDEYEKIVHIEAQKKRMQQQTVSTGRGGSGNVRTHADDRDVVKPRARTHSLSIFSRKKKKSKDSASSRPSTASTIGSNASNDQYELREYTIASGIDGSMPIVNGFGPYTTFNAHPSPVTPITILPPVGSSVPDGSDTPRLPHHRLAVSSAPPFQPLWRLQYQRSEPVQTKDHIPIEFLREKEKETMGKLLKKSSRRSGEDNNGHLKHMERLEDQRSQLHLPQAAVVVSPREELRAGFTNLTRTGEIPRIPMRNPYIPSHIDYYDHDYDSSSERSLSSSDTQILNEVRMLAESKMNKNGVFSMQDLEEILAQAGQLHKPETIHDVKHPQLHDFPLPPTFRPTPPSTLPPLPPHSHSRPDKPHSQPPQPRQDISLRRREHSPLRSQIRTPSNQVQIREDPELRHHNRSERKENKRGHNYSYPSPINRQTPEYTRFVTSSPTLSNRSMSHLASSASDEDIYASYDSQTPSFSKRSTQSNTGKSALGSMSERQPVQPVAKNLVKQRSDSALERARIVSEHHREKPALVSGIRGQQRPLQGRETHQPTVNLHELSNRALHPVHEEEDVIYIVDEEEPYTSFIDI